MQDWISLHPTKPSLYDVHVVLQYHVIHGTHNVFGRYNETSHYAYIS